MPIKEVETHPYLFSQVADFNDQTILSKYSKLIIGTFPIYSITESDPIHQEGINFRNNWGNAAFIQYFYGSCKSHFWRLFSSAFNGLPPNTPEEAVALLENSGFLITDIFQSSERKGYSPLDSALANPNYNQNLSNIIQNSANLKIIYFTSKEAKKMFAQKLNIPYVDSNDIEERIFGKTYRLIVLISPAGNGRTVRYFFQNFPLNEVEHYLRNNSRPFALGYRQRYYTNYLNIPVNN